MKFTVKPWKPKIDLNPDGDDFIVEQAFWLLEDGVEKHRFEPGWRINFASLPSPARVIWRTWGKWSVPTVVHDCMYRYMRHLVTRAYADRVLRCLMRLYGANDVTCWSWYLFVRCNLLAEYRWRK